MNKQIELGLEGAFKVDIFSGNSLVSTTDYFSNFITPTGLSYPFVYPFADCFRYLSIGRSALANSGTTTLNNLGVTGLFDPINSYRVSDGSYQTANHIGWPAYATGGVSATCGTVVSEQGPRFYRAWNIPSGNSLVMDEPSSQGLLISEFMVSPSSGLDPTGKYAFSRVVRNLFIPNGHRAVVSYQLRINIQNTGVTFFSGGTFRTGNAEVENDAELLATWANLSGYYRQVYHGLRCVDNIGMTFLPKYGDGLEPSTRNTSKMLWYLSPDNSQFDVNDAGSNQASVFDAYKSAGLMAYIKTIDLKGIGAAYQSELAGAKGNLTNLYHRDQPLSSIPTTISTLTDIRIGRSDSQLYLPMPENYSKADIAGTFNYQSRQENTSKFLSYATPGAKKYNQYYSDFGKQAVFSSFTDNLPFFPTGQNLITGRKKTLTRKSVFSPMNSMGYNTRFGSMVYAYNGGTASPKTTYYPYIDVLFFDTSGRSIMPHYRWGSGFGFYESGTGIVDATVIFSTLSAGSGIFPHTGAKTMQAPNIYGSSNSAGIVALDINNVTVQYNGWGGITGFRRNSPFQSAGRNITGFVSLVDHNVYNLTEPSPTGKTYWPTIHPDNEVVMSFTGVTYYHPKLSGLLVDSGAWFGPTKQIVRNIYFPTGSTSPYITTVTGAITPQGTRPTILTVGPSGFVHSGYFLTTRRFENVISAVGANMTNNSESGVLTGNQFITGTGGFALTGYVIPSYIIDGKLNGTVWNDAGLIPTLGIPFTVQTTITDLTIRSGEGGSVPAVSGRNLTTITGFFSGLQNLYERGYLIGTGGTPIKANDSLYVFFTGFSGNQPIYVTRVSRCEYTSNSNTVRDLYIDSTFTGIAETTDFCYPSARLAHSEYLINDAGTISTGYRLLPHYSYPTWSGASPTGITIGGEYPALSMDNGLEVYLDISWSSPCGSNTQGGTCYEPI